MDKVKILANRLISEGLVKEFECVGINFPGARMKTLDTGKDHPVIYETSKVGIAPTVTTGGFIGVCVNGRR